MQGIEERFKEPEDTALSHIALLLFLILAGGVLIWFIIPDNIPTESPAFRLALADLFFVGFAFVAALVEFGLRYRRGKIQGGIGLVYFIGGFKKLCKGVFLAFILFPIVQLFIITILGSWSGLDYGDSLGISGFSQYFFISDIQPNVEEVVRFALVTMTSSLIYLGAKKKDLNWNWIICFGISCFLIWNPAFALYHWGVLGGGGFTGPDILDGVLVYAHGCGFSVVNQLMGTAGFSLAYHKIHNTYGYFMKYGIPDVPWEFMLIEVGFYWILLGLLGILGLFFIIYDIEDAIFGKQRGKLSS